MNPDVALVEGVRSGIVPLPASVDSSPIARALGMRIEALDPAGGTASVSFIPADVFVQGAGVLQGGAVAAMLDFAIMMPVMAGIAADAAPATTNLDVAYFRAAPPGTYTAEARLRRKTRSLIFAEATLHSAAGEAVAAATSTILVKSSKPGS